MYFIVMAIEPYPAIFANVIFAILLSFPHSCAKLRARRRVRNALFGQLTKSTAIDFARFNVRVNCISPGTIDTSMLAPTIERFRVSSGIPIADIYEMLKKAQPIHWLGTPEEIARVVRFLLSDECPFMPKQRKNHPAWAKSLGRIVGDHRWQDCR
jgi:hypothetical protein